MHGRLFPSPTEPQWCEWRQDPPLASPVFVKIVRGPGGRLILAGLRIDGPPSAELLRSIPIGRIEAAANGQLVAADDGVPGGGIATAVRRPGHRPGGSPAPAWAGWDTPATATTVRRPEPHAVRRGRPDRFYADIADAYRTLAQTSARPAADLAHANDVPVTTAHRWVKEARRRGFLPPGAPGKAG